MNFTGVSYFLKIVGLFIFRKLIVPMNALGKLFKNILFSTQSKPLTIITKRSILDVAAALDPPLIMN